MAGVFLYRIADQVECMLIYTMVVFVLVERFSLDCCPFAMRKFSLFEMGLTLPRYLIQLKILKIK